MTGDPRSFENAVLHQTERDLGWTEPAPVVVSGWARFWSTLDSAAKETP